MITDVDVVSIREREKHYAMNIGALMMTRIEPILFMLSKGD